ncbi:MAG TPA: ABC transporter permease subunit [Verrucomicrobiae bacterium]|nr:ABC transporter permease subunit [Verrucomicrobiae bacterium]
MTFLPIVERELRINARQRATHRMRLTAALLALVVWFAFSIFGNIPSTQRAQFIFATIGVLSLGFAILAGAFLTADCLSEERRDGTLGLLFLTDLKGHDVVLGKLASTSLNSIYGLIAVVPMLAVPLLMGGVTGGEFARTALVLLTTLFLSLAAGMFVSAVSLDSRVAFLRALAIMVILSGVLPLLWWGLRILLGMRVDFLLLPSPGYALRYAGDAFYSARGGTTEFWTSLLVMGGLGILFLAAASVMLPRLWRQGRDEGAPRPAGVQMMVKRRNRLKAELESRPYFWLATRDDRMARWANRVMGLALLVWFAFYVHGGAAAPGRASFLILVFLAFGLHVLFKCIVAAEATRRLSEDRQNGALELLLVTPLRPGEIITGQKAAEAWLFRWPKFMLVVMNLLFIGLMFGPTRPGMGANDRIIFALMFLGGILLLFTDCFVMGSTSVWAALTTKRHARAILKTIRIILLPGWIGILGFWFLGVTSGGLNSETVMMMVITWIGLALGADVIVLSIMRRRLNPDGFRELVATGATRDSRSNTEDP